MTVTVDSRQDLTLEHFRRVALGGEGVRIGPEAHRVMAAARESFMALLDSDRTAFIYGTTTRAGIEVGRSLEPGEQRAYARAGRRNSSPSFGGEADLDEHVVRGIVFARLANFVEGNAKTRPVIAERVAALLDHPLPTLSLGGQDGPGEVVPLIRLMSGVDGDFEEGEPMALVNGSPCAAALAADIALASDERLHIAEQVFALSVDAFRAPLEAYDRALEELWEDEHEAAALRGLREWLAGASEADRIGHQAPVSYRILPRVLGQAHRAVAGIEHAARVSLRSVTDNPVYLPPDEQHPLGRAFSTGGYHNGMVYPSLGALAAAWADLAFLAERHVTAMHVGATAGHLPRLLERPGGSGGRTNLLGWVAGSFLEDARHAASVTLLPAGLADAQNDVAVPTFVAYRKARAAGSSLDSSLALLAASSSQALWATDTVPAPPLRSFVERIRSSFPPVDDPAGRELGDELAGLARDISSAAFVSESE
ncbi:MAG TPA: aromatic amino acid lyase [Gaiellaceae bacterium]|jgi:histidine ammonia-lyase